MDEDKKIVMFRDQEISYQEAIKTIAEWWEAIKADGINIAAEVQQARRRIVGNDDNVV
jgi:hypothetical protein